MINNNNNIKVILIGEGGTGKTSLIRNVIGLPFCQTIETTSANSFSTKQITINKKTYNINLWDTIGQEKYRALTKIFIKESDIVVLVYDITNRKSFTELEYWYNEVEDILGSSPILGIAGNKYDLFTQEEVKESEGEQFAKSKNAMFKLTSAKTPELFNELIMNLVNQYLCLHKGVTRESIGQFIDQRYVEKKKKCCK